MPFKSGETLERRLLRVPPQALTEGEMDRCPFASQAAMCPFAKALIEKHGEVRPALPRTPGSAPVSPPQRVGPQGFS